MTLQVNAIFLISLQRSCKLEQTFYYVLGAESLCCLIETCSWNKNEPRALNFLNLPCHCKLLPIFPRLTNVAFVPQSNKFMHKQHNLFFFFLHQYAPLTNTYFSYLQKPASDFFFTVTQPCSACCSKSCFTD